MPLLGSPTGEGALSSSAIFDPPSDDYDEIEEDDHNDMLLPLPHLTPMPLIGGSQESDVHGRIYAAQIASIISRQAPSDRRQVVVGLGVDIGPRPNEDLSDDHRKEFLEVVRLTQLCQVW